MGSVGWVDMVVVELDETRACFREERKQEKSRSRDGLPGRRAHERTRDQLCSQCSVVKYRTYRVAWTSRRYDLVNVVVVGNRSDEREKFRLKIKKTKHSGNNLRTRPKLLRPAG